MPTRCPRRMSVVCPECLSNVIVEPEALTFDTEIHCEQCDSRIARWGALRHSAVPVEPTRAGGD